MTCLTVASPASLQRRLHHHLKNNILLVLISLLSIITLSFSANYGIVGVVDAAVASHTYASRPVIEWQKSDVEEFLRGEFPDQMEYFETAWDSEQQQSDFTGNDLIMLDEEELEQDFGILDPYVRKQILQRIQHYEEKAANGDLDISADATGASLQEYWLTQDISLPEHKRRFNLEKLTRDMDRTVYAYFSMWVSSPSISFLYFYFTNANLLKRMLHLPLDYEFQMQDFALYIGLGRPYLSYRAYELGYFETNPYITLLFIICHAGYSLASLYSLFTIKMMNPMGNLPQLILGTCSILYIMPSMLLGWKTLGATLLMQSVFALPQAILNKKMANLAAKKKQKQADEAAKKASEPAVEQKVTDEDQAEDEDPSSSDIDVEVTAVVEEDVTEVREDDAIDLD